MDICELYVKGGGVLEVVCFVVGGGDLEGYDVEEGMRGVI